MGYECIKTPSGHAECCFCQFILNKKGDFVASDEYDRIVALGCSRIVCKDCDRWLSTILNGQSFVNIDNKTSSKKDYSKNLAVWQTTRSIPSTALLYSGSDEESDLKTTAELRKEIVQVGRIEDMHTVKYFRRDKKRRKQKETSEGKCEADQSAYVPYAISPLPWKKDYPIAPQFLKEAERIKITQNRNTVWLTDITTYYAQQKTASDKKERKK